MLQYSFQIQNKSMLVIWRLLIMPPVTGKYDSDLHNRMSPHYRPLLQWWNMVHALSGAVSHWEKVVSACGNVFCFCSIFSKLVSWKKNVAESFVKRIQLCQCSVKKNTQQTDFEKQVLLDRNKMWNLVFLSDEVWFILCGNETAKMTDIGVPKILVWFLVFLYMTELKSGAYWMCTKL